LIINGEFIFTGFELGICQLLQKSGEVFRDVNPNPNLMESGTFQKSEIHRMLKNQCVGFQIFVSIQL